MPKMIKYIIGCCLLFLLNTKAGAQEITFDLADINTAHASFAPSSHRIHSNHAAYSKEDSRDHHKHSKKYRSVKRIVLTIYVSPTINCAPVVTYKDLVFTPSLPDEYRYIFYREINPPPPKAC